MVRNHVPQTNYIPSPRRFSWTSRSSYRPAVAFPTCAPNRSVSAWRWNRHHRSPDREPHRRDDEDAHIARNRDAIRRIVSETRARGYAVCDYYFPPESNSIAAPIFDGDSVLASMRVTWHRSALTVGEAAQRFASKLNAAAKEINERCGALHENQAPMINNIARSAHRRSSLRT